LVARRNELCRIVFRSFFGLFAHPKTSLLLVALSLVTFAALARLNEGAISTPTGLQCGQLKTIWNWSVLRYGGNKPPQVESDDFAKKVALQFINKHDSNRFLISTAEEQAFVSGAPAAWKQAFQQGDCTYFENFEKKSWAEARRKAEAKWTALKVAGLKLPSAGASVPEKDLPKFVTRPSGEKEYDLRLQEVFQKLAEGSSANLRNAYGNDLHKLTLSLLNDSYFSEESSRNVPTVVAKSMLSAMDRYSTFFPQAEFDDFYQELAGTVTGIGIRVAKIPGGILIEKVLPKSPAERSKLRAGDVIVTINGQHVQGRSLDIMQRLLKGNENSLVRLTVKNRATGVPRELNVRREVFSAEESRVTSKWLKRPGNTPALLITVPSFYGRGGIEAGRDEKSAAEDVENILTKYVNRKDFRGPVVLDLRGNPGGYLEEAVTMGGLFLGDKVVVGVVERNERRVLKGGRVSALYHGPLAVWVDDESASAAEVLSGALKDHGRALVVGNTSSYGKGSVQRLFHLGDDFLYFSESGQSQPGGVVKVTTSYFYSPLGHNPSNGGVVPHVTVNGTTKISSKQENEVKEASVKVSDTSPFVPAGEVNTLRRRDTQIRHFIAEVLTTSEAPNVTGQAEEEKVAKFAVQFARLDQESL